MGLFSNLFGKKSNEEEKEDKTIFFAKQDELMKEAIKNAQQNFKYFWRELYWEYRRIVPAHDFAMIKMPFEQQVEGHTEPLVEHMWINNINFDGKIISGELVNDPNQLTNITKGDIISTEVDKIDDWMISINGKTLGGYTIQLMRSGMGDKERKGHDQAWGLDFGDYNEVLLVHQQKEKPENLVEHPMSKNMADKTREFLKENPDEISFIDKNGFTLLHKEAIAGNSTTIEILLELGADKTIKSNSNKTASNYAALMAWDHLNDILN